MGIFKRKSYDESTENTLLDNLIRDNPSEKTEDEEQTVPDYANMDFVFDPESFKDSFNDIRRDSSSLDIIKKKVEKHTEASEKEPVAQEAENLDKSTTAVLESLLKKCKAFTVDDDGNNTAFEEKPLYTLESVDEILKSTKDKILENLSENYSLEIQDETKNAVSEPIDEEESPIPEKEVSKTTEFIKMVNESINKELSDDQKFEDYILTNSPDAYVDNLPSSIPDISDIDNTQKINQVLHDHSGEESTLRYVPVINENQDTEISVSSITQNINLTNQLNIPHISSTKVANISNDEILGNEFDDYIEKNEINSKKDISKNIVKFAKIKRNRFFCSTISFFVLLINSLFLLENFNYIFLTSSTVIVISLVACLISIISNIDMFSSFKKISDKTITADLSVSIMSVSIIALVLFEINNYDVNYAISIYKLIIIYLFLMFVRSLVHFFDASTTLRNLKVLSTKSDINAIDFIDDQSVALAIAKDSIDGDVLIAAPRKTNFLNSFIKHSNYNVLFNGKYVLVEFTTLLLAIFFGVLGYVHYDKIISALFCAVSILTIGTITPLFFINVLPKYSASKKLSSIGAMIAGIEGANRIENANAVLLSTNDLFPEGTIILKDIKVLSDNSIDDTILKAASLTEAVGSTLAPIFKQIAKTNSAYTLPDSDTVKYEDTLGLSGWVDNELLFIGNRALMESHGIDVPSFEVDKRILRNGCFPIYLATVDKACALIIVKYNPDFSIARKLRKVTSLGITVLLTNCDQNITETMIADNFDVYEDSIKIISNVGKHMYETSMPYTESINSPAAFRRKDLSFISIMNAASSIKKSNNLFTIFYIVASIMFAIGYIYLSFISDNFLPSANILIISHLFVTFLSLILYIFKKP